jgi:hypothetical protein
MERPLGVKLWQGIVRKDHVESLLQVIEVLRLGFHPRPVRLKPRPAEFMQQQLGISRAVFKNQHV